MQTNIYDLEVDRNFDAFLVHLASILPIRRGEFALMSGGVIEEYHPTEAAALAAGRARHGDGLFSVQEVTDRPADLGFFSHAIDHRIA